MENADALDLSKENIQPLKRGRNTTQLGLALQAQTDASIQQMRSKKQESYEMQIRAYEGSDPLEIWCEYISWVEQSYPKHGPEGHLRELLANCVQHFKDEEKYKNDIRFVRIWIKYIEMQSDSKQRLELFQVLHNQCIGLRCAEFYCTWAYEYQSTGDWKQAKQVYEKGYSAMALPTEELDAAYQQFSAAFVHMHRNEAPDELVENSIQGDHRLPMAALKPVGKKSAAPNVRVGPNVRSHVPGLVPISQGSSGRSMPGSRTFGVRGNNAGPVAVYQGDSEAEIPHGQTAIASSSVPIPQSLNKENIVKAGPWTSQGLGSRKHQSSSVAHSFVPRQPGFEVHRDDDGDVASGQDVRPHGVLVPNALKPRKALEDGFHDAMNIIEGPCPNEKAMYRKNEVYGGGKEFQLEELHALDYFRQKTEKEKKLEACEQDYASHEAKLTAMQNAQPQSSMGMMPLVDYPPRVSHEPYYGDMQIVGGSIPEHSFRQSRPTDDVGSLMSSYNPPQAQTPTTYETAASSENLGHYNTEFSHHLQPPMEHRFQASNQSLYNQSMTLHTKLAMHEVNNLWESPTAVKPSTSKPHLPGPPSTNMYLPAFQIMKDDSQITHKPIRSVEMEPHNHYHKPKEDDVDNNQPPVLHRMEPPDQSHKIGIYPANSPDNYPNVPNLFEDPMTLTSYMKHQNGFQVYQEAPCPPVDSAMPREKFQVFCDEDSENNVPTRTCCSDRGDLSLSTHTSGSIQKVAKEKENIHKFPQADIELMEDCGVSPVVESGEGDMQHQLHNHYGVTESCNAQMENNPSVFTNHHSEEINPPTSAILYAAMQSTSGDDYNQPPPETYEALHGAHGALDTNSYYNQNIHEPMDDDAPLAAAPQYEVNMSETGITEAFFFPKMSAASTPFQTSPKKSRASRNTIDFNSSVYRVEQSWPDEEDYGPEGSNRSSDTPKTVPPLKLFRVKNDEEKQLSAIMEASKEKYQSTMLSSASSRNSMSSASAMAQYGGYASHGHSLVPEPYLRQIEEASEPSSSSHDMQSQLPATAPAPTPGPESQLAIDLSIRIAKRDVHPFDTRFLAYFLSKMGFPLPHHADGYFTPSGAVPSKRNNNLSLNGDVYKDVKTLGEGAYAKVLRGVNVNTQQEVALKIQKPSCRWEYYICREIQHRLSQRNLASAFMPAEKIYVYTNGSVIVTDLLPFGTLLNLVNKVVAATKKQLQEIQVLFLLDQLISAVAALHACKIIHGDLKPDNILIKSLPSVDHVPCIQLIDFGRSIDMSLMLEGTTFNQVVMTDTFTCIEMRTGRPWTYQTDLFGLANTAHCLLLGDYMKVQESRTTGRWTIQTRLPRHVNSDLWVPFFDTLLNIESCDAIPDLETLRADVQGILSNSANLSSAISALSRILLSR